MLHLFFLAMLVGFLAALITLPVATAPYVPWWGTLLIILGELVLLRYTFFKILGLMFGMFVSVGLRLGTRGMRDARVDVHSIAVVPPPGPEAIVKRESGSVDEDEDDEAAPEADAPGTRYVKLDCTVTPSPTLRASSSPVNHYEPGAFKLSSEGFAWPSFPPTDDETRTGELVAAALVDGESAGPIPPDRQLVGSQRLALTFKCPPTLRGRAKLKFLVLTLASVDVP